ncbi:MAG TPA: anti-sigma factor [Roseiflexaceae bacterium]|nr:anti-sigma factor [Roseiflexaceae bacterium]
MSDTSNSLCEELQPRLAAYALGEDTPDDEARHHLEACPACQRAFRDYAAVAGALLFAAPDAVPPPALRERVIAAVAPQARQALPHPTRYRPRLLPGLRLAFAAALALLIALLGWNLSLRAQVQAQAALLANSREGWQTTIALLNDPDVQRYPLRSGAASGSLWTTPGSEVACFVVQGLPAIGADRVYQVWLVDGGAPQSAGVFEARNGNGWVILRAGAPVTSYRQVAVTVEPRGGSAAPTGPQVLTGELGAVGGQG